METSTPKKEPTSAEAMFFFSIVRNSKSKLADVDWDAVAADQGFKNAGVAKVCSFMIHYTCLWLLTVVSGQVWPDQAQTGT